MKNVTHEKATSVSNKKKPFFGNNKFFAAAPVMPKLTINQADDSFEQEADRVADKVMRMSKTEPAFFGPVAIQRKCEHCEEEEKKKLQKKDNSKNAVVDSAALESYTGALGGAKGAALPNDTREFFESRMGYDFSKVKIHNDNEAAKSADNINALAYTLGNHIVFNQNKFSPSTDEGKKLLAHELTHVVQQRSAVARKVNTNEMIPGFASKNQLASINMSPCSIQRAKIDHRDLVWGDFQGKVPKGSSFGAETSSDFTEPDLSLYPFKPLTEVENGTTAHVGDKDIDCEKGMSKDKKAADYSEKYKAYKVNIEPDITKLLVKAYMSQENSWAQPWTSDKAARATFAQPQVNSCISDIKQQIRQIEAECKKNTKECEKYFKKNPNSTFTLAGAEATNAEECKTVLEPACIADAQSSLNFSFKNKNDTEATAAGLADCDTSFKQQMVDAVLEDSSTTLLSHEQRHFDITHQLAEQMATALQNLANGFDVKEVEACSKGKALESAAGVLKKQRAELKKAMKPFKDSLSQFQIKYDAETKHGTIPAAQSWWGENIDTGLTEKSGKGKF